jgi:hypothetical protein
MSKRKEGERPVSRALLKVKVASPSPCKVYGNLATWLIVQIVKDYRCRAVLESLSVPYGSAWTYISIEDQPDDLMWE